MKLDGRPEDIARVALVSISERRQRDSLIGALDSVGWTVSRRASKTCHRGREDG